MIKLGYAPSNESADAKSWKKFGNTKVGLDEEGNAVAGNPAVVKAYNDGKDKDNEVNEKSYTVSEDDYLSASDLKKMKVGTTVSFESKWATKVGPDKWKFNDRIDTFEVSSSKLADIMEDTEIEVNESLRDMEFDFKVNATKGSRNKVIEVLNKLPLGSMIELQYGIRYVKAKGQLKYAPKVSDPEFVAYLPINSSDELCDSSMMADKGRVYTASTTDIADSIIYQESKQKVAVKYDPSYAKNDDIVKAFNEVMACGPGKRHKIK